MNKVSINLVILNGEKYISNCLESFLNQDINFNELEFNILDNGSSDRTIQIIEYFEPKIQSLGLASYNFIKETKNLGMWGGQEYLLTKSTGPFVIFLSVDVILDKNFIKNAIATMESDPKIGCLQAKIYQYDVADIKLEKNIIDTCGFQIYRSRRIGNIGHGQKDEGQFDAKKEIFGVEGAVPVFKREALESIRVADEIADHDIFWYGEDLDVAWRLNLAGCKQIYDPSVIAWHDRGTTKSQASGSWWTYFSRVSDRRKLSIHKRRLEWRNTRWTRIKNDYIINILKDLLYIGWREIQVFGFMLLFEPGVLKELPTFIRGIPKMIQKRRIILARAVTSPNNVRTFFIND